MDELSDEERIERDDLRQKRAASKAEAEELKCADSRTPAQQAKILAGQEAHQVGVKKLRDGVKAYEVKWGRSPWDT